MVLSKLTATNFRNIRSAELQFSPGLNLIYGDNGSGKTTLLEAIMSISRGHSFRTRKFTQLIQDGASDFTLFGLVNNNGEHHRVGIQRSRQESRFRIDGRPVVRSTELTRLFPAQVLDAQSFSLFEGGPKERRSFLDWLVFHVKHQFADIWSNYNRCLKQRNALLRRDKLLPAELGPWNEALASSGAELDKIRRECIALLLPVFTEKVAGLSFIKEKSISVDYVPGWDVTSSLLEQMESSLPRDIKLGHTSVGPHRSDLKIQINGKSPVEVLSRGQQKSVISTLYDALMTTYSNLTGLTCVILIDDLPSELDDANRRGLIDWLSQLNMQIFATGIFFDQLRDSWPDHLINNAKMFHVKHGCFTEHPNTIGEEE